MNANVYTRKKDNRYFKASQLMLTQSG